MTRRKSRGNPNGFVFGLYSRGGGKGSKTRRSDNPLIHQMSQHRLIGHKEEVSLCRRANRGDRRAMDELVRCNIRFIIAMADRIRGPLPLEDALSEGVIGFMRAVRKFEPSRGYRLGTYASWHILARIRRASVKHVATIHIPLSARSLMRRFRSATENWKDHARTLCLFTDKERDRVDCASNALRPVSLDAPADEDGTETTPLLDLTAKRTTCPGEVADIMQFRELFRALGLLTPRERDVIMLRHMFGLKLDEVAVATRHHQPGRRVLTRERIRQIEEAALKKLRKRLQAFA